MKHIVFMFTAIQYQVMILPQEFIQNIFQGQIFVLALNFPKTFEKNSILYEAPHL